jgi:hypothetical protein
MVKMKKSSIQFEDLSSSGINFMRLRLREKLLMQLPRVWLRHKPTTHHTASSEPKILKLTKVNTVNA